MLNAIYYREINQAIMNGSSTITSVFDEYFERSWIFKCFKKLGKLQN